MAQERRKLFRFWPDGYQALQQLNEVVKGSGLEPALLELVKLRASQINGCASCIDMHAAIIEINAWNRLAITVGAPEPGSYELDPSPNTYARMVPERDVDCGALYEAKRGELVALMRSLTEQELAVNVPATPEWSVRDVLSHVTGVTADLNAQHFGPGEAWTAAQVHSRRNRSIDEVVEEWDREAPVFESGLRLFGYEMGSHYIGDLLQHTGDVLHALGRPRPPDDEGLAVALDFYLISFEHTLDEAALGAVQISDGRDSWTLGTGTTIASVTAEPYELFRSLGGRRSAAQIRAMAWNGDVDAILPVLSRYPLPRAPILEAR